MDMTRNDDAMADLTADDFAESMRDTAESGGDLSGGRAERFYDRVRGSIQKYLETKGRAAEKISEYLLLVPDVFILLWRLANDARVHGKNKVLLVSALSYYVFPFDIIPEGIVGPVGYLDDLVFAVYVLNKIVAEATPEVLRAHWSGSEDILESMRKVLNAADNLVGSEFLPRIRKMLS